MFDNEQNKYVDLESKVYIKYLGVLIDKNLSWKYHIDAIATKISKNVGLIAKLRHYVPRKILLNFYKSLIQPYLPYGPPAWDQAGKTHLNKILILQKRALRLLFFADVRDRVIPLFLEANVLPITFLYHECVSSLMYDINSNNAPINMLHLFKEISSINSYNTRLSTSGNFYVQNSRLEMQKRSFSRLGVRLWNEIPCHMRVLPKKAFKRVLRTSLLNILQNKNDYIQIPVIIKKVGEVD